MTRPLELLLRGGNPFSLGSLNADGPWISSAMTAKYLTLFASSGTSGFTNLHIPIPSFDVANGILRLSPPWKSELRQIPIHDTHKPVMFHDPHLGKKVIAISRW